MGKIIDINENFTACKRRLGEIQNASKHAGFVYLLKLDNGIYKIGLSNNLKFRLEQYYVKKLEEGIKDFYIYFVVETDAPKQLEDLLHKVYNSKRVEGTEDHFRLTEEDILPIRVIAERTEFKPDFPKPRKIKAEPGTLENFSSIKFGRKEELKAVVQALFISQHNFSTIKEIQGRMPIGDCEDVILRALNRVELREYVEKKESSYRLNDKFWDDFRKRTLCIGYTMDAILRPETEEDRKQFEAAGMVHCPSCGNPVYKTDVFMLDNGTSCCFTEYVNAAFKKAKARCVKDGYKININGIPELVATGDTKDQCRGNFISIIREWIAKQQRDGLTIPDLNGIQGK